MPFAGEVGWWLFDKAWDWLLHEALRWLLKHPLRLLGLELPIGGWILIALAVIVAVVMTGGWVLESLPDTSSSKGRHLSHVWAAVFWTLVIVVILWFLVGW